MILKLFKIIFNFKNLGDLLVQFMLYTIKNTLKFPTRGDTLGFLTFLALCAAKIFHFRRHQIADGNRKPNQGVTIEVKKQIARRSERRTSKRLPEFYSASRLESRL